MSRNPAVGRITTSDPLDVKIGDLVRLTTSGITLVVTAVKGRALRVYETRQSPLPRRLP